MIHNSTINKAKKITFGTAPVIIALGLMFVSVNAQSKKATAAEEIERLTKNIERYPKDDDSYVFRARAYVAQHELELAVADFTKVIELDAHIYYVSLALNERGTVYVTQGKYSQAIADYSKVIESDTADVYKIRAYVHRAEAHHKNGDNSAALEDIDKAIAGLPRFKLIETRLVEARKLRAAIVSSMR